MSTRKITEMITNTREKVTQKLRKINKTDIKRIGLLTAIMVVMPLVVHADSNTNKPTEPLSKEQSQKLATNLAQFSPTANKQPEKVKIEVAPDPQPAPAPEEQPTPAPAPTRAAAKKKTRKVASRTTRTGKTVVGSSYEQCVPFARELSGVQVRGYAGSIQPNSQDASVGSVALFAGYGHAAVVTGINGDSVTIKEANYVPGQITERTVPMSQLRGYVK